MKKILIIFAVLLAALPLAAQKTATVNMQKVFSSYERTKQIEEQLNRQMKLFKEHADILIREYQELLASYETERNNALNATLKESERESSKLKAQEKREQLKRKEAELAEYDKSCKQQVNDRFEKQRNEVIAEIKAVIKNYAVLHGYQLVLDISGATLNDLPTVLYSSQDLDISQSVINELNRAWKSKAAGK